GQVTGLDAERGLRSRSVRVRRFPADRISCARYVALRRQQEQIAMLIALGLLDPYTGPPLAPTRARRQLLEDPPLLVAPPRAESAPEKPGASRDQCARDDHRQTDADAVGD